MNEASPQLASDGVATSLPYGIPYTVRDLLTKCFAVSAGLLVISHQSRFLHDSSSEPRGSTIAPLRVRPHHEAMVAKAHRKAPSTAEAGRRGALSLHRSLSLERRRQICVAASQQASLKRRGLPTERKVLEAYVGRLREVDDDLAGFIRLSLQMPVRFVSRLHRILTTEERGICESLYMEAVKSAQEAKQ